MKIICVCYENLGLSGGSAIQVIEIAKNLARRGHEVQICAPLINRYQEEDTLKIKYIPTINFSGLRFISYLLLTFFYQIYFVLKFKPDIVLLFEIYLDPSTFCVCEILHIPYIFFVNAIAEEELHLKKTFFLAWVSIQLLQKLYCKGAKKIFTISEVIKNYLQKKYYLPSDKIRIIKNGVDTDLFRPIEREIALKSLTLDDSFQYIGFVGRLFPWHGVEDLVQAAPLVIDKVSNVKFLIVGSGQMLNSLVNKVKELNLEKYFIFTGSVPYHKVPLFINICSICVVFFKPVRSYPGDPMKLYEYLACEKPVIASNVEGYGDFVERIGAGMSVNSENKEEVAIAIVDLLQDKMRCKQMGKAGREETIKFHSWEKRAREIERYLTLPT